MMCIFVSMCCLLFALVSFAQTDPRLVTHYGISFGKYDKEFTSCNTVSVRRGYVFKDGGEDADFVCSSASSMVQVFILRPQGGSVVKSRIEGTGSALAQAMEAGFFSSKTGQLVCNIGSLFPHVSEDEDKDRVEEVAGWPYVRRCRLGEEVFFIATFFNQENQFLVVKKGKEEEFLDVLRALRRVKRN